jgi:hypothetical protein
MLLGVGLVAASSELLMLREVCLYSQSPRAFQLRFHGEVCLLDYGLVGLH